MGKNGGGSRALPISMLRLFMRSGYRLKGEGGCSYRPAAAKNNTCGPGRGVLVAILLRCRGAVGNAKYGLRRPDACGLCGLEMWSLWCVRKTDSEPIMCPASGRLMRRALAMDARKGILEHACQIEDCCVRVGRYLRKWPSGRRRPRRTAEKGLSFSSADPIAARNSRPTHTHKGSS